MGPHNEMCFVLKETLDSKSEVAQRVACWAQSPKVRGSTLLLRGTSPATFAWALSRSVTHCCATPSVLDAMEALVRQSLAQPMAWRVVSQGGDSAVGSA
jgi:hypothetical protein